MQRIAVYCGARSGETPDFAAQATALGTALARRGIGLVYGGGNVGLMGVVADAVLDAGGEVTGVIPEALVRRELAHPRATAMHVVRTMHERKALMADLAEGFVAMAGGFGTLDETFEMLTWAQLGLHGKPIGLYNAGGYYDGLLHFIDHMVDTGFVRPAHRDMILHAADPAALLDALAAYQAPVSTIKWDLPGEIR